MFFFFGDFEDLSFGCHYRVIIKDFVNYITFSYTVKRFEKNHSGALGLVLNLAKISQKHIGNVIL